MTSDILYLCSQSASRKQLLHDAGIRYHILSHNACEKSVPRAKDFATYIERIATTKLAHTELPTSADQTRPLFMLAADTMVRGVVTNEIFGKPHDYADAVRIITTISQQELEVTTGCALRVYNWRENSWHIHEERIWSTASRIHFCVEQKEIDVFLKRNPHALHAAGATTIEGNGAPYLKTITGSYSGVLGLPLYELKEILVTLGFQFNGSI